MSQPASVRLVCLAVVAVVLSGCSAATTRTRSESRPTCPPVTPFRTDFDGPAPATTVDVRAGRADAESHFPDGGRSLRARTDGGGQVEFARIVGEVSWAAGTDVWFGARMRFPVGFSENLQGATDLIRWDNHSLFGGTGDHGGIAIWPDDGRLRVIREQQGTAPYTVVTTGPRVVEDRWLRIDVHQVLSARDGSALTELYVDGSLRASTTRHNSFDRPVTAVRFGLVSTDRNQQQKPLELFLDDVTVGCSRPT